MEWEAPPGRRSGVAGDAFAHAQFLAHVPDRRTAIAWVTGALTASHRHGQELAALVVDIDRLSNVNHQFGSDIGDKLLLDIATRLRGTVRPSDFIARLGNDAFLVVCERGVEARSVEALARRILRRLTGARWLGETTVRVSVSIGIAYSDGVDTSADRLIADAEAATRHAKKLGGARFHAIDRAAGEARAAAAATSAELAQAERHHEFVAYFQPIVRLSDMALAGYETLVRWMHPARGLLAPDDFIHIAEESGAVFDIGRHMLLMASQQYSAAKRANPETELHVAVNVSMRQLLDRMFVKRVAKSIRLWRMPPGALVVELTESSIVADRDHVAATVRQLRDAGAAVAIDDFGIGYSSLMRVGDLPIDYLKVDKSFVAEMLTDPVQHRLVQTTIDLAHALGAEAVAEGVESSEVAKELRRIGCDQAQGYLWGRPMPADELLRWQSERQLVGQTAAGSRASTGAATTNAGRPSAKP